MAILHLRMVERLLRDSRIGYTKTQIQRELKVNYNAILEAIAYLLDHGMIRQDKDGKYIWKRK